MHLQKSFEIYEQFLKCQKKTFPAFYFQTVNEIERVKKKKPAFVQNF